jgi:hypothetical protein
MSGLFGGYTPRTQGVGYQDSWFHNVQAGVTADFDRVSVHTWEQFVYGSRGPGQPPARVVEERIEGPETTQNVRAVLGGGAKLYFNPRAFVRTDGRWSFDRSRHNIALRVGLGIDF